MDVVTRIDELLRVKGISGYKMCADLIMSRSFMTELRKGRAKGLTVETAGKLAMYFDVPVKFLTGEPPFDVWEEIKDNRKALLDYMWIPEELLLKMYGIFDINALPLTDYINFIDSTIDDIRLTSDGDFDIKVKPWVRVQQNATDLQNIMLNSTSSNIIPYTQGRRIPIIGSIPAGVPVLAQENIEGYDYADVPENGEYFYLRVKGDSMMNANIFDGSLVLVRSQSCADNGEIVVCLINGDEATLKRCYRQKDMVILKPENPAFQPIIVSCKDFDNGYARILGVAIEVKFRL